MYGFPSRVGSFPPANKTLAAAMAVVASVGSGLPKTCSTSCWSSSDIPFAKGPKVVAKFAWANRDLSSCSFKNSIIGGVHVSSSMYQPPIPATRFEKRETVVIQATMTVKVEIAFISLGRNAGLVEDPRSTFAHQGIQILERRYD